MAFECNPVSARVGYLSKPDGSAMVTQGRTVVIAAIYGPTDVRIAKELTDRAFIEVIFKPKSSETHDGIEATLQQACETMVLSREYPRTRLTIVVQEVQNSGSFLTCCLNACCLALLDSGIQMKHTIQSVTCAVTPNGELISQPNSKTEKSAKAVLTFGFENTGFELVVMRSHGLIDKEIFKESMTKCRTLSLQLLPFFQDEVANKVL